jgi:holo-[acyl-carrier protein] synthase
MPPPWPTTCVAWSSLDGVQREHTGAVREAPAAPHTPLASSSACDVGFARDRTASAPIMCDIRRIEREPWRAAATASRPGCSARRRCRSTWRASTQAHGRRAVMRYLATRFSAKEAFSKAIGLGLRMPMTWRLCEVGKLPSGKPVIVLHGALKAWFEAQGLTAHVSVTDETDYAASFCVVEKI